MSDKKSKAKSQATKLTEDEWEHFDLLAEETGVNAHAYRAAVLRAHLKQHPIDEVRRKRIEQMRAKRRKSVSHKMEKMGLATKSHLAPRSRRDARSAAA